MEATRAPRGAPDDRHDPTGTRGAAHEQIEPGRPPPARLVPAGGKPAQLVDVTATLTNQVVALRADGLWATTSNTDRAALGGEPAKGGDDCIRRIELVPAWHTATTATREGDTMDTRRLGTHGPEVSALGLGAMGMSDLYGPADEAESIATIHAAVDAGITLIDTGDFYGSGHNEMLIRDALKQRNRDDVVISVKFGSRRGPDGGFQPAPADTDPVAVKDRLAYTLRRLGTDHVDIYRPTRLNPNVPIEDTVGAIAELVQAGYVRYVGLSEVGAATLRRAAAVHPISDLQIEYSLLSRGIENSILPTARELGTGITAYGVLSRGLLSGHWNPDRELAGNDFRGQVPRFQGENLRTNLALVDALGKVAQSIGATVAQVAIAWVASRGTDVVPLVGARRRQRLQESLAAADLDLTPDDLAAIEAAVPPGAVAGDRYPARQMAVLDSER